MAEDDLRALFAAALEGTDAPPDGAKAMLIELFADLEPALSLLGLTAELSEDEGELAIDVLEAEGDEPLGFIFADGESYVFASADAAALPDVTGRDPAAFLARLIEALPGAL